MVLCFLASLSFNNLVCMDTPEITSEPSDYKTIDLESFLQSTKETNRSELRFLLHKTNETIIENSQLIAGIYKQDKEKWWKKRSTEMLVPLVIQNRKNRTQIDNIYLPLTFLYTQLHTNIFLQKCSNGLLPTQTSRYLKIHIAPNTLACLMEKINKETVYQSLLLLEQRALRTTVEMVCSDLIQSNKMLTDTNNRLNAAKSKLENEKKGLEREKQQLRSTIEIMLLAAEMQNAKAAESSTKQLENFNIEKVEWEKKHTDVIFQRNIFFGSLATLLFAHIMYFLWKTKMECDV